MGSRRRRWTDHGISRGSSYRGAHARSTIERGGRLKRSGTHPLASATHRERVIEADPDQDQMCTRLCTTESHEVSGERLYADATLRFIVQLLRRPGLPIAPDRPGCGGRVHRTLARLVRTGRSGRPPPKQAGAHTLPGFARALISRASSPTARSGRAVDQLGSSVRSSTARAGSAPRSRFPAQPFVTQRNHQPRDD